MVEQHDGSKLTLRKLAADYELHDRGAALGFLQHHAAKGQIVTGLLYVEHESENLHAHLHTVERPLNALSEKELCPGQAVLDRDQRRFALGLQEWSFRGAAQRRARNP